MPTPFSMASGRAIRYAATSGESFSEALFLKVLANAGKVVNDWYTKAEELVAWTNPDCISSFGVCIAPDEPRPPRPPVR